MDRNKTFYVALGSYVPFAFGLALYLIIRGGTSLFAASWKALYWSYFISSLVFLLISLWQRFAMFPKLTTYFQIWGTLGTFVGLIQMCNSINYSVNAGDTDAIKGVLGGFSTALYTSLIGMLCALINDMLPEREEANASEPTMLTDKLTGEANSMSGLPDKTHGAAERDATDSAQTSSMQPGGPHMVVFQTIMPPVGAQSTQANSSAGEKDGNSNQASDKGGHDHETT